MERVDSNETSRLRLQRLIEGALWLAALALIAVSLGARWESRRPAMTLAGIYPEERSVTQTYRFTRPDASIVIHGAPIAAPIVTVRLSSPDPLPQRSMAISVDGRPVARLTLDPTPRTLRLLLPVAPERLPDGSRLRLEIVSATTAGDLRALGALLAEQTLRTPDAPAALLRWMLPALLPALLALLWAVLGGGAAAPIAALLAVCCAYIAPESWAVPLALAALAPLERRWRWVAGWLERLAARGAPTALALGGCAAFALAFGWLSVAAHRQFLSGGYDLGIFAQWVWLLANGKGSYSTVIGTSMLADHATLLFYPLAALYALWPHIELLLTLQACAVAAGGYALFCIGRERGAPWAGLTVALAYLAHPAVQNMTLFDFHADSLASGALALALLGAERRRVWMVLLGALTVLAAKEAFALAIVWFGLWLMTRRMWRLGLGLSAISGAWLLFAVQVLMPAVSGQGRVIQMGRFARYGASIPEIGLTLLTNPGLALGDLLRPDALTLYGQLFAPFALLPLLAPGTLLLTAPMLLLNVLSAFAPQSTITYHYTAIVLPVVALAALDALLWVKRHLADRRWCVALAIAAALMALGTAQIHRVSYVRTWESMADLARWRERAALYRYVVAQIPADAPVSADFHLQPHLSGRVSSYVFPNPFLRVAYVDRRSGPTPTVPYVVADLCRLPVIDPTVDAAVQQRLVWWLVTEGGYRAIVDLDGVVLLVRAGG